MWEIVHNFNNSYTSSAVVTNKDITDLKLMNVVGKTTFYYRVLQWVLCFILWLEGVSYEEYHLYNRYLLIEFDL